MKTSHAPAGAIDGNFEFFEENGEVYFMNNGHTREFRELDIVHLDELRDDLESHNAALKAMEELGMTNPIYQLKQWAICNFGNFDNKADLTEDGVIIHEHVNCEKRGTCKFEGIICQPLMVENGTLTLREVQIIKLVAMDLLDKQISDMLGIAFNTMAKHRTNIEKKIGCHSKAGITAYAYQNNLM
jgi:DNA-binding CsgD family transcriptional regulator